MGNQNIHDPSADEQYFINAKNVYLEQKRSGSKFWLPPRNLNFAGREKELSELHALLIKEDKVGITQFVAQVAAQGRGGIGKSALALEYAYRFMEKYQGGVYWLTASGLDITAEIAKLWTPIGLKVSAEEEKNTPWIARQVKDALQGGEVSLLILDNITQEQGCSHPEWQKVLPTGDNCRFLLTTRLPKLTHAEIYSLDILEPADALALFEKLRTLRDDADRRAAEEIVSRLGFFALAIEVCASYLARHPNIRLADYLQRLEGEGLEAMDAAGKEVRLSHYQETIISKVLTEPLETLSKEARFALECAAFMPPDMVPIPWLEAALAKEFPEFTKPVKPGYPDPKAEVIGELTGLRLLTPGSHDQLLRMHRLFQEAVQKFSVGVSEERLNLVSQIARMRAYILTELWVEKKARWEIEPLSVLIEFLYMEKRNVTGLRLANMVQSPLAELARFSEGRVLLQKGLNSVFDSEQPEEVSAAFSNLALIEQELGNLPRARELLERDIAIKKKILAPDHQKFAISYSNLSTVERESGNLAHARELQQRAIVIREKHFPPDHPTFAIEFNNLSLIERELGNLPRARELLKRAIAIDKEHFPPDHPRLATRYDNLALVETDLGNLSLAHDLHTKAIAIDEKNFPPDHPNLAIRYNNLASVLYEQGKKEEACKLLRKAYEIFINKFGSDHPDTKKVTRALDIFCK